MRLILITSETQVKNEIAVIKDALDKGFYRIHVKRGSMTEEQLEHMLDCFTKEEQQLFVVHSNYEAAEKYELAGIHLPEWRRLQLPSFGQISMAPLVSTSFHSVSDLESGISSYEYAFIGPVYDSISKSGYSGKNELKNVSVLVKKRVVPVGGIKDSDLSELFSLGFTMAAVRGYVWNSENPVAAVKKLADKVQSLKNINNE